MAAPGSIPSRPPRPRARAAGSAATSSWRTAPVGVSTETRHASAEPLPPASGPVVPESRAAGSPSGFLGVARFAGADPSPAGIRAPQPAHSASTAASTALAIRAGSCAGAQDAGSNPLIRRLISVHPLPYKVHPQALPAGAGQYLRDRLLEAHVCVADHQPDAGQAPLDEAAEKLPPKGAVFARAQVQPQHLALPVRAYPDSHHQRHALHPAVL